MNRFNYATIKNLAKEGGYRITDLIALAPANDPFYVGTPGDLAVGKWFAELWERFGYGKGVHLRRIHYQIVSQSVPVKMPNGLPYENTEQCWDMLGQASKMARYLGLVDPAAFDDRRNHEPIIFAESDTSEPWLYIEGDGANEVELPEFPKLPSYELYGYRSQQRYHLEIWCEKTTMDDVLKPLAQKYGANLIRGVGELSITATLEMVKRLAKNDKPARIFYISDFDPAGKSMPLAVSRKVEYFVRKEGLDIDVRLFPILLTEEQVQQYDLPRTPIKETEKRKDKFQERFGAGATELDAMEALYPGRLQQIVSGYLDEYYDHDLDRRTRAAATVLLRDLRDIAQKIMDEHAFEIGTLRDGYEELKQEFTARLASHNAKVSELWQILTQKLEDKTPDLSDYPVPEPEEATEESDNGLYNSGRDYLEQIGYYKEFQGKA